MYHKPTFPLFIAFMVALFGLSPSIVVLASPATYAQRSNDNDDEGGGDRGGDSALAGVPEALAGESGEVAGLKAEELRLAAGVVFARARPWFR